MTLKQKRKRIYTILVCSGILLALYYLLPIFGYSMEGEKADVFMSVGLIPLAYPLYLYGTSIVIGVRFGFCSSYAVAAALLFFPTLLVHFHASYWVAGLIYGAVALAGNLMGWGVKTLLAKMRDGEQ